MVVGVDDATQHLMLAEAESPPWAAGELDAAGTRVLVGDDDGDDAPLAGVEELAERLAQAGGGADGGGRITGVRWRPSRRTDGWVADFQLLFVTGATATADEEDGTGSGGATGGGGGGGAVLLGDASSVLVVRTGQQVQELVVTHDASLTRGELQHMLAGVLAGMEAEGVV